MSAPTSPGADTRAEPSGLLSRFVRQDPELVASPFALYDLLRQARVTWSEDLQAHVVARYQDIVDVLRAPETFSSARMSGSGGATPVAQGLLDDPRTPDAVRACAHRRVQLSRSPVLVHADPPRHSRQRSLVNKAFTPRRVAALEPSIRAAANEILDESLGLTTLDYISSFATPLPIRVIGDFLGVSKDLRQDFKRWSDALVAGLGNTKLSHEESCEIVVMVNEFYDYFQEQIADRREHPRNDFLSDLVVLTGQDAALTPDELLQMLVQFLVAGNETTTMLLGATMHAIAERPELQAEVRGGSAPLGRLVEEVLRLEAPTQGLFRTATEDAVVGGVPIPAGANLFLVYAAGNRDPEHFPAPDELVLDRPNTANSLAFGLGPHFCLGAPLARLETQVGLETFLGRVGSITLDCPSDDLRYIGSYMVRGLKRLPLQVGTVQPRV